jgi:regulation of enolase protein 1 (concanavalin A-like superfamily)
MNPGESTVNLLSDLNPDVLKSRSLSWDHPPLDWEALPSGGLRIHVQPRVDYFQDPAGGHNKDDAPYLWLAVNGDFVAQAHLSPNFTTTWDAGALMARFDAQHWGKLCYESTDLGTHAAVSVVTNGKSDDANGVNLTSGSLLLQIFRAGDVFGMHYALDGKSWQMVRLFSLPGPASMKVGLVAQCPAGPGTTIDFFSFSVEHRTLQNLRAGA